MMQTPTGAPASQRPILKGMVEVVVVAALLAFGYLVVSNELYPQRTAATTDVAR